MYYLNKLPILFSGQGGFLPPDRATCLLWLDPTDTSTITESSGSVSLVADKSGSGNNASQPTGANQPTTGTHTINSLNVLKYDGTNDSLILPAGLLGYHNQTTGTIFMVCVANTFSVDRHIWSGVNGASNNLFAQTRGSNLVRFRAASSGSGGTNLSVSMSSGQVVIFTTRKDSGTLRPYANGVPLTTQSSGQSALTDFWIGNNALFPTQAWDGTIGDSIIYQDTLNATDCNLVGNYLATKYGTSWTNI